MHYILQDGDTALHKATLKDDVEIVRILVRFRAAVDIMNKVNL